MPEGSETPSGERGSGPEGRLPRGEGDLLAERRARRAAESGEAALSRRAEAAEATVQTLERHVASLQQRLRETEDARRRIDEQLEVQRTQALERESELRRVKQREYAEQQLRVEVEERLLALERESRAEIEGLGGRLSAREREARDLALRLQDVQRRLAEAEQAAAAEAAAARARSPAVARPPVVAEQHDTQERLGELERRAGEIERRLDAERAARERSERLLESMREGHRRMEALVAEMKDIVARVSAALAAGERARGSRQTPAQAPPRRPLGAAAEPSPLERLAERQGADMADALASAVERLRARAEAAEPAAEEPPGGRTAPGEAAPAAPAQAPTAAPAPVARQSEAPRAQLPTHKHSLSWFARWKIKRKQRRTA